MPDLILPAADAALVASRGRAARLTLLAEARRRAFASFLSEPSSMASVLALAENE
jgi:hypothetical protein